jgi:hypothetical protein
VANKQGFSDMKCATLSLLAVVVLAGLTGCITQRGPRPTACMGGSCAQAPENCQCCNDPGDPNDPGHCRLFGDHSCPLCNHQCPLAGGRGEEVANDGPPTGAITYPYYTTRGPRDFLAKDPPSIGP